MFSLLLYTWIFFQSFSVNFTLRVLLLEASLVLKSCGVVGHEILVTAPEAKFPFPFLDLTETGTWSQACQQDEIQCLSLVASTCSWSA